MKRKQKKEGNKKKASRNEDIYYHKIFFKVLHHYFKPIKSQMRKLNDFRMELMCKYVIEYMIFTGILFFVLKLEYKRQLHKLKGTTFIKNLNKYLGVDLDTAT